LPATLTCDDAIDGALYHIFSIEWEATNCHSELTVRGVIDELPHHQKQLLAMNHEQNFRFFFCKASKATCAMEQLESETGIDSNAQC
jgi:hypothetical protein